MRRLAVVVISAALVFSLGPSAQAGALDGPKSEVDVIGGYCTRLLRVYCDPGELEVLAIGGPGAAALDVVVCDLEGNVIAQERGWGNRLVLTWVAQGAGPYLILVHNNDSAAETFVIQTN